MLDLKKVKEFFGIVKMNFASIELQNGTILTMENGIEEGSKVYVEVDGEKIPAPAGEYITGDGNMMVIISEDSTLVDMRELTEDEKTASVIPDEVVVEPTTEEMVEEVIDEPTDIVDPVEPVTDPIVEEVEELSLASLNEKMITIELKLTELINQFGSILEIAQGTKSLYEKVEKIEGDIETTRKMIPGDNKEIDFKIEKRDIEPKTLSPYEAMLADNKRKLANK